MKQKHFIDSHKGATGIFILCLIFYFDAWENINALVYLAIHGSYGLMWIMKSMIFPDKTWEQQCTLFYGLYIWCGLTLYWISPYIIIANNINNSPQFIAISIFVFILGVFFHFTSDMQKFTHLKLKPGQLIEDGMMYRSRNMNYFGELLIYLSFSMLAYHWLPFVVLFLFILIIWVPNMIQKDKSLSRYKEYQNYKKRSSVLFPFIW